MNEILDPLTVLRDPSSARRARSAAEGELYRVLTGPKGRSLIHKDLCGNADPDVLHADAVAHVLLKAGTGSSRFKGTTEGQAAAWCKTLMHNHVMSAVRVRSRVPAPGQTEHLALQAYDEPSDEGAVLRLCEAARERVVAAAREKDRASIDRTIRCFLDSAAGVSTAELIDRYEAALRPDSATSAAVARLRARNLVYQHRRRGANALYRGIEMLADRLDPKDRELMAKYVLGRDASGRFA